MDLRIAAASILVVEDDWLIADQIETLVVAAGYKVIGPTGHLAEAIELAAREQIAAALLDIELSRGDQSYPVAEALMARGVPFAFVSSLCRRKIDSTFQSVENIGKPFRPQALVSALFRLIGDPPASRVFDPEPTC